jgi:hypothetical protein
MIFNDERYLTSLEHSNIRYQYESSITNFYPDFKISSPSYINVNSTVNIILTPLRPIIKT